MFSHYLIIALRNLRQAPFTALVNVFTLALGLVSFVAAYAVVGFWNGSERHFANMDRTYVITASLALRDGSIATGVAPQTNELYEKYLRGDFPEFEAVAKVNVWSRESSVTADGEGARVIAMAADPQFLDIFDLPFIAGDRATALRDPSSVLLSEAAAIRLFGSTDVIGRTVTLGGNLIDASVSGVVGRIPEPSHLGDSAAAMLRFELIAPYELYRRLSTAVAAASAPSPATTPPEGAAAATPPPQPPQQRENWLSGYCCTTYVMLREDSKLTLDELNRRLEDFAERRMPPEALSFATVKVGAVPVNRLMVTALDAQLLGSATGSISIVTLLFAVGALVLGVACVNYASLATARALRRAREIGLRKVVGAQRAQIVFQYLFEAGLLAAAALAVAVLTVYLLAPAVYGAIGIDLRLALFGGLAFWLFGIGLLAVVTLLGGGYPALLLSRVRPIEALRLGRMRLGPRFISTLLVGTQFTAASLLVIAVLVMYAQNVELRRTGLGAAQDPHLVINNFGPVTGVSNALLWEELRRLPQVKGVTQMASAPWSDNVNLTLYTRTQEEGAPTYTAFWNSVGYDFFSTLDIPLIAGRTFERERNDLLPPNADISIERNIVIDRAYAEQLGFATPEDAVDVLIHEPEFDTPRSARIIGVVESRPLYLRGFGATANAYGLADGANMQNQVVRLAADDVAGGLAAVEEVWRKLGARVPLQRRFMDEMFEENYRNFGRINIAFAALAVFAISISLIGLFGMAVQTVSRRLHEIGVRKSLGAENGNLFGMLLYDFSKPVLIANLLTWPIAWYAAQAYLSIFIRRVELTPLPFVLSLALVLLVAWMAVASQALRAARVRPAQVLRFE